MLIEGNGLGTTEPEDLSLGLSRRDEAFRPDLVFNPYIQRMFQVCFFSLFFFIKRIKSQF